MSYTEADARHDALPRPSAGEVSRALTTYPGIDDSLFDNALVAYEGSDPSPLEAAAVHIELESGSQYEVRVVKIT